MELGKDEFVDVFAGVWLDATTQRLTVYTNNEAEGRELAAAVRLRVRAADRSTATVEAKTSKYSDKQLAAARAELWRTAESWMSSGVTVHYIATPPDGSGIQVGTNAPTKAAGLATTTGRAFAGGVAQANVTFEFADTIQADVGRGTDDPPYKGGIHLNYWDGSNACTSAFGMHIPGHGNRLMTAAHCARPSSPFFNWGNQVQVGRVQAEDPYRDAATIIANTGSGVYAESDIPRHYAYPGWSLAGEEVCQSGRTTVYRCGVFVTRNTSWALSQNNSALTEGIEGCTRDGTTPRAGGDSGGPWFNWLVDGRLASRGIHSAGRGQFCALWTQTPEILQSWRATLLTSP